MSPIRVLLADDHDIFRSGLRRLLDEFEDLTVVGEARRGAEAVDLARTAQPDVLVLDVRMPGMTGVEAAALVRDAAPGCAVLMLTVDDADDTVVAAVLAGASGYLVKDAQLEEIAAGIRAASAGRSLIAPSVAGALLDRLRRDARAPAGEADDPALSGREQEVLARLVAGEANGDIAAGLHLSLSTVKSHVAAVLEKLGAENRVQAAVIAVRRGLVA